MNSERKGKSVVKIEIDPEEIFLGFVMAGIPPRTFIRRDFLHALAKSEIDPAKKARLEKRALEVQLKISDKII